MLSRVRKYIHQDCKTEMNKLYGRIEEGKAVQNYALLEAENKIKDLQEKLKKAPDGHAMTKWAEERAKETESLRLLNEEHFKEIKRLKGIVNGRDLHVEGLRSDIKKLNDANEKLQSQLDTLQMDSPNPPSPIPPFDESSPNDSVRLHNALLALDLLKAESESSKKTIDDLKNQLKQTRSAFGEYKKNCKPRKNKKDYPQVDVA